MTGNGKSVATLIGDLVGSREAADRSRLQALTESVLETVNELMEPVQPIAPTVGDEFQGAFSTVAEAVRASLLLELELLDKAEVGSRYGLGFGSVSLLEERSPRIPRIQDGSGWWSARAGIDRAKNLARKPSTSFSRTCFGHWEHVPGETLRVSEVAALNAFLLCRDAILDRMGSRSRRNLVGLMRGRTQAELAKREGVSQSAISQDLRASGATAIVAATAELFDGDRIR